MIAAASTRSFDIAVVVHVLSAVAALVVVLTLRAAASGAAGAHGPSEASRRSFTGRRELAGRAMHLIPLTGLWVLAASRGADTLASGFVIAGLALWLAGAVALEAVAFPAQRQVAASLDADPAARVTAARRMLAATDVALAAILVAGIVMVASQA